jgi:ComF family protein
MNGLLGLLFPAHCAGCGRRVEANLDFCGDCEEGMPFLRDPLCQKCSHPFPGTQAVPECPNCHEAGFAFEFAVSVVQSRKVVREMIHRVKYGREIWLTRPLAGLLRRGLDDHRLRGFSIDALMPVPLHPLRLREREFNQAALLAAHLSRVSGLPVCDALQRLRYTGTQTALDRRGRRQNLRNAFSLRQNADVSDLNLLLIDDVLTTGATLDACAAALLEGGAASVRALTLARG